MLSATCHCRAVRLQIPRRPRTLTNCNCSICRRYGTLWAYFPYKDIVIAAAPGATASYAWGDRQLRFVRCASCGCIVNWEGLHAPEKGRAGVNARLFEPELLGSPRIRRLDGARTWRCLREDE
ncbi:MAG: GFA family protein [Burkholderiales bacterium]|nr:GFA family protein [Burkholderiales bacterium]